MASQSLYRKYRSQTFSQVVGQEHVTRTLLNELETGRIAHAYLFCGPRGTGKTSTARILAKALNCTKNGSGEPCNECSMCIGITEGRAFDLIEIDAASNRGIDEIRDLRERVNFAPNEARFKVYIIDEVHMLTDAAFNALLKTLEEPPAHSIFILATTEPHKIPPTIFSRCQRFDFHRIPLSDSVGRLSLVCAEEGIEIEQQALELIAKSATGSLRDAENLLDQVYAYYGNPVSTSQVMSLLGLTGDARVDQLAQALLKKDAVTALSTINSVANDGFDLKQFNRQLVDYLRGLLLIRLGLRSLVDFPEDQMVKMDSMAQDSQVDLLHHLVKGFSQIDFRYDGNAALLLELAVVESIIEKTPVDGEAVASIRSSHSDSTSQIQAAQMAPKQRNETAGSPARRESAVESETQPIENQLPASGSAVDLTPNNRVSSGMGEVDIKLTWSKVLETLQSQPASRNVVALIRDSCEPVLAETGVLRLNFFYKFHREKANEPRVRQAIESAMNEVTGERYRVSCDFIAEDKEAKLKKSEEDPVVKAALDLGGKISGIQ